MFKKGDVVLCISQPMDNFITLNKSYLVEEVDFDVEFHRNMVVIKVDNGTYKAYFPHRFNLINNPLDLLLFRE